MKQELLKIMKERRSVRSYKKDLMIPEDVLQEILETATYAPTGGGRQSPVIIAVTDKTMRDHIAHLNAKIMGDENADPFYGAPVILVVLANKAIPTHVYDGSLVMGNLMNAAESLGVANIWIHRAKEEFESDFGKNIFADLGIEGEYEGIGHCALGYAVEPAKKAAPRKEDYVYYIR